MRSTVALCVAFLVATSAAGAAGGDKDEPAKGPWAGLEFRSIGPAIGGRVTRVAGVAGDRDTYYLAAAQGGVFKSDDGGASFAPVFDEQSSASIGSIAVAPSDPNVVYVGGGEANIRGNVMAGWGLWRSTDAGRTWTHQWKAKAQIGTIVVDPRDADIAYAAVLGSPFGPSDQRGVYRTRDGGRSWTRTLFVNADTGASDVAIDRTNPRILFAGTWQARRRPWSLESGGPGSGLYRSGDGGDHWTRVEHEKLPTGPWGKVGVAVAPSDGDRVYALIEAEEGGLFRSDDGGESWERVNAHRILRQRAWYYSTLTVDPLDPDRVYFPQVPLLRSVDGGRTLTRLDGISHSDVHDVWIDPADPQRLIIGHDGGVDLSSDGGRSWRTPKLALAQFYNIDVDRRVPWHVGGTIQDMGTASGPNLAPIGEGPTLADWRYVGGGEAGDFKYALDAPGHVYAGEYGGYLSHYVEGSGRYRNISAWPANPSGLPASTLDYRFQWTAPLATSPHDPKVLYHGANVLFRTRDRGETWEAISPDLTRDDPEKQAWSGGPITGDLTGVETYDTIFSIAESPRAAGTIWVGTDDGLVQLTRDGGKTWTNVTPRQLPAWATVEGIEASHAHAGRAYVAVEARRLDDQRPYLFRTDDYGARWTRIDATLPEDEPVYVLREDPTDPKLLYVGTERGVYVSRDGGERFDALKANLPPVAVVDLELAPDALVLGTRRGLFVLDDLGVLRALDAATRERALWLAPPTPAYRWAYDYRWDGEGVNEASAAAGLRFAYRLREAARTVRAEILDADGKLLRTLDHEPDPTKFGKDDLDEPSEPAEAELGTDAGLHVAKWDLRVAGARRVASRLDMGDPEQGPRVPPGRYVLRLIADGERAEAPFEVRPDPRHPDAGEARAAYAFAVAVRDAMDRSATLIDASAAIREQTEALATRLASRSDAKALEATARAAAERARRLESRLHNPEAEVSYDILAGREGGAKLYSQLSPLHAWAQDADLAPTPAMRARFEALSRELASAETELMALRAGELATLEREAAARNLPRVLVD